MGFSSGYISNNYNRSLQRSGRSRIYKNNKDISVNSEDLQYNTDFEKQYSSEQLQKMKEKVRGDLRKERMKQYKLTLIILPIVLWGIWMIFNKYLMLFSLS